MSRKTASRLAETRRSTALETVPSPAGADSDSETEPDAAACKEEKVDGRTGSVESGNGVQFSALKTTHDSKQEAQVCTCCRISEKHRYEDRVVAPIL